MALRRADRGRPRPHQPRAVARLLRSARHRSPASSRWPDAVQKRRLMGIGRVDLANRKVDFQPIGPATPVFAVRQVARRQARLRPHARRSATTSCGRSTSRSRAVLKRTEFEGRPRMAVRVSSNGKLVYVYVAGATVDIWDAATHKYLRTMSLGGDQTTELFVLPRPRRRPTALDERRPRRAVTSHAPDADLRRAFAFRRPVLAPAGAGDGISLISTGLSLVTPYLSKDLVDHALVGRDLTALVRIVGLFAAARRRQLRAERGQRPALHAGVGGRSSSTCGWRSTRHLQQLSPRFYARTRLGDIVSRLNSDIGEIQRVAAEAALAWVGNVLFLVGLRRDAAVARLAAGAGDGGDHAAQPVDAGALPAAARSAGRRSARSAAPTSAAS